MVILVMGYNFACPLESGRKNAHVEPFISLKIMLHAVGSV